MLVLDKRPWTSRVGHCRHERVHIDLIREWEGKIPTDNRGTMFGVILSGLGP